MDDENVLNNCCENQTIIHLNALIQKSCEEIFDGILLWPETFAGDTTLLPCPGPHSKNKYASKYCMENGTWYIHPFYNRTWTNYSDCWTYFDNESAVVNLDPFDSLENVEIYKTWVPIIKSISFVGYILSLCLLIISLIIFATFKKLHCARNKLHMHLFLSFIMRGVTYLLKELFFVEGTALSSDLVKIDKSVYIKEHHDWRCKLIMTARNFSILANFMFILMEGIYLTNLMFITIFSNNKHVLAYCVIGWGLSSFLISIWVLLKLRYADVLCWTLSDIYDKIIIKAPITLTVIINSIIFIVMLRVLYGKINSMNIQEKRVKYRKLVRSTLTLVLLLGTPYTISEIISYNTNLFIEIIWLFLDQTFTAFQGLIVAFMYCLLNSEVQTEIKQKYKSYWNKRQPRSRTISNTQQFTVPLQEDNFDYPNTIVYWHRDRCSTDREITYGP